MLEFVSLGQVAPPAPVAWLWDGLLPLGCLSLIGGPPGVGKSSLVAGLEVAIASGAAFLERAVCGGAVIHADFDTDLRLQYLGLPVFCGLESSQAARLCSNSAGLK